FAWAVQLNRFGLKLIGLWPVSDEVAEIKLADLRVVIIFIIVTFVSGIPLVCSLARVWGDMLLMVDNLQITLPLLVVSLKLAVMRWKRAALLSIVRMMAEDWMDLTVTAKEKNVMIGRARMARAIVISGYVLMVLAFIVVIVLPYFGLSLRHLTNLTDPGKPLPLQMYYFYDTDESPRFELMFTVQAVTIFLAAVTYTSVDAFLGLAILHFCGQLENFRRRIALLSSCQNFIRVLGSNVLNHLRLIRFASIIEDTFTLMMLGLVVYFGIVFCLHGFLLFTMITENSDLSFSRLCFPLIGITILLSHTFLYCGAGEMIINQCEEVYRAMCDLEWYQLEPRKARSLVPLMIRARQPFRITAGKIFPLTMTTFCNLLKTSAGYISFLLAQRG
ncbi:OrU4, partial [Eciton burchellii]